MPKTVEISHRTILFILFLAAGLWFVWAILDIILSFLIAIILMAAFNPWVNYLESKKIFSYRINRSLAIVFIYLIFITIISIFITLVTQPLISQTSNLVKQFPLLFERISNNWGIDQKIIEQQISQINTLPQNLFKLVTSIFSNLLAVFTTLVMAFYLLLEREKLHIHLSKLIGNHQLENKVEKFLDDLEIRLGGWLRAEALLMLIVGVFTYLGLTLLRVPFALPLAIIAGFMELIPNIGPTLSAVPAVIVGITISPLTAIGTIALYIIVQLLENNFIVPQVMSKAVGVNPLVTILVLLIGFQIGGVKGAIMAVPLVLIFQSVFTHFFASRWYKQ